MASDPRDRVAQGGEKRCAARPAGPYGIDAPARCRNVPHRISAELCFKHEAMWKIERLRRRAAYGLLAERESHYRDLLAAHVAGRIEVTIPLGGRADVMTETDVWEVEPLGSWKHGLRQAIGYAALSGLRGNVAVYGRLSADAAADLFETLRAAPVDVRLWIFDGVRGWELVGSSTAARREWRLAGPADPEGARLDELLGPTELPEGDAPPVEEVG